jgi:hypothetical protein
MEEHGAVSPLPRMRTLTEAYAYNKEAIQRPRLLPTMCAVYCFGRNTANEVRQEVSGRR